MPDVLDANGLTVKTATEITEDLKTGLRSIYGETINLDSNSPDGEMVGIITQVAVDIRELALEVNGGFDPDQALGVVLDQRVVINNIARAGGTFTIQPIAVVVDRTVALQGLDDQFNNVNGTGYTVQDSSGNEFILIDTVEITAGTHSLSFRAKIIGNVDVPIDSINVPVTIVLGVLSVNNPSAATSVGQNQETDAQLRTRRQKSVALSSNGYLDGLLGVVLALDGVTEGVLYENVTNATDGDGIPAHGIWLIVDGGANSEIGDAIYNKKSYGANMKGDVDVDITTPNGNIFTAKFSRPVAADLYIRFDIQRTVPEYVFDEDAIKEFLADNLFYTIGQYADTSRVTEAAVAAIASQGGGGVPVNVEISDNGTDWVDFMNTPTLDAKWTLDASNITVSVL